MALTIVWILPRLHCLFSNSSRQDVVKSATMPQVDDHEPRCSQPLSLCAAPVSRYQMALFPALFGETMHLLCVIQISMYDVDLLDIWRDTPLVFKASLICFYWKRRYERQVARYAAEHRSMASSLLSVVMTLARKCNSGTSAPPVLLSPALVDHLGSPSTLSKTSSFSSLRSTVAATPQLSSLKLSEICNDQDFPATASRISLPSPRALASPIRRIPVPRLCLNSTPGDLKTLPFSPRLLPPGLPGFETIVLGSSHTTVPPAYTPKVVAQPYSRVLSIKDLHPLKLIGWGAFGVVYLARDCVTQTELAVKVLCKAHLSSKFKGGLKPVFEEQRAMRMTHGHKGFLPLHASWHDSEYLYLATEYYPNGDLMKEMRQWKKIPPSHARFYAAEILLALDELHKLGVIHRDIKPPNLLFDREGHLSLADFGLARVFGEPECESTVPVEWSGMSQPSTLPHGFTNTGCGTLSYMAPEAHQHKPYSFSVDFWSLGVLLYEMLTGRLPFGDSKQSKGIPRAVISDELTFRAFDRVDDITQDFLRSVLAKDPNARLSVAEMKAHTYFESIDWDAMANRTAKAPWIPLVPPRGSHTLCLSIPSGEPYAEGQDPHPSYTFTSPMLCRQRAVDHIGQVKAKSELNPDNVPPVVVSEPLKFGTWKRLFGKSVVHRAHVEPARARPHVKRVAVPRGSLLFVLDKTDKNTCLASEASTEDSSSLMVSPANQPRPQQHPEPTSGAAKAVAFVKLSTKFRDWLGWRS